MFPPMKWYESFLHVRVNIIIFRVRFGSGFEYRQYLRELQYLDIADILYSSDLTDTDSDLDTYSDFSNSTNADL